MKIIKHGNVPRATATCPVCGCEFEYEKQDVEEEYAFTGQVIMKKYFIRCPECGTHVSSDLTSLNNDSPVINYPPIIMREL